MSNERELGRTRDVYGHANVRARQSFRFLLFHGYVEQALGRAFAENVQVPRLGFRHNARSLITPLRLRQRVYELVAGCGVITGNPETFPYIGTRPPPKLKKETSRMYRTCALVGNGPGLQRDGMGEIIDKHDAVIRFNTFVSSGVGKTLLARNLHFACLTKNVRRQ